MSSAISASTVTVADLVTIFEPPLPTADRTLTNRLDTICRFVRYGELPQRFDEMAYGIQWARQTGRLSGTIELALRGLSATQLAELVLAAVEHCRSIGEMPAFLVARLAG